MALRDDSIALGDSRLSDLPKLAIVLGAEEDGLAASTIAACDYTVRIPMGHGVDSLNVAAAKARLHSGNFAPERLEASLSEKDTPRLRA